jgi:hypothetical protein
MMARTERNVRENVGGGWGEPDRDVMTDYQKKRLVCDPRSRSEGLLRRALKERVQTVVRRWKRLTARTSNARGVNDLRRGSEGAAVAAIEEVVGEEHEAKNSIGR